MLLFFFFNLRHSSEMHAFVCFVVGCAVASCFILSLQTRFPPSCSSLFLFLFSLSFFPSVVLHPSVLTLTRLVWHGSLSLSDVWDGRTLRGNGPSGGFDEGPERHHHRLNRLNHTAEPRPQEEPGHLNELISDQIENGSPLHLLHPAWILPEKSIKRWKLNAIFSTRLSRSAQKTCF